MSVRMVVLARKVKVEVREILLNVEPSDKKR